MKKYTYKNIELYYCGGWNAGYRTEEGKYICLHVCCCRTKSAARDIAKSQVDFLNERR